MLKKRPLKLFLISLSVIFLSVAHIYADTVKMKNGGSITGTIVSEDNNGVVVDMGGGQVTVNKADIKNIEKNQVSGIQQTPPVIPAKPDIKPQSPKSTKKTSARENKQSEMAKKIKRGNLSEEEKKRLAQEAFQPLVDQINSTK